MLHAYNIGMIEINITTREFGENYEKSSKICKNFPLPTLMEDKLRKFGQ